MLTLTETDAAAVLRGLEAPRISVPVTLIQNFQDAAAAIMLAQAVYLSSLKSDKDYWFDLPQVGPAAAPGDAGATLWSRLGSWHEILGVGPGGQARIRKKIDAIAPGLLETRLRHVPARLEYRVLPSRYLQFMIQLGLAAPSAQAANAMQDQATISSESSPKSSLKDDARPGSAGPAAPHSKSESDKDKIKLKTKQAATRCSDADAREVVKLYNDICSDLPGVEIRNPARLREIKARWRDLEQEGYIKDRESGLKFFRKFFDYVHKNDFLCGRRAGRGGQKFLGCGFDWLFDSKNFPKIIEGNYNN